MKKIYKVEVDCANCAAKMEEGIKKIAGVKDANVSFLAQKMTIEAEDEKFDEIMKSMAKEEHRSWDMLNEFFIAELED